MKRALRWLALATLGLYVAIIAGVIAWGIYSGGERDRLAAESARTNDALCALRHDLEVRAQSSREFLADHPRGVGGIPASAIRVGLMNSERTIAVLGVLRCDGP